MVSFKNAITPTELADFLIQKFHDFSVPVKKAEEVIAERSARLLRDENLRLQNIVRFFQSVTHNNLLHNRHQLNVHSKVVNQESRFILRREADLLSSASTQLKVAVTELIQQSLTVVSDQNTELRSKSNDFLRERRQSVDTMETNVRMLDPINILRRGFTITLDENGKAVKDIGELQPHRTLTTIFANGSVASKIETINSPENHE
jgi:exodeoxyribonuclease VII large subunit